MILRTTHLFCLALAAPAAAVACGTPTESVRLTAPAPDLALADGRRLRLAGLQVGPEARAALDEWAGRPLRVARLAPAPDRWGRLLVDLVDADGQSLALDLLARGLAEVRPEPETRACEAERLDAEAAARLAGEGLWAKPGAILNADDAAALAAADGRFALVYGTVRRVGGARAKVYLDFATAKGFAVVLARKLEPQFRRAGVDVRALPGQRVRVRGVVDNRFGPRIEVSDPAMIEILEKETRGG